MIEIGIPFVRPPTVKLKETNSGRVKFYGFDRVLIESIDEALQVIELFPIEKIDIPIIERR